MSAVVRGCICRLLHRNSHTYAIQPHAHLSTARIIFTPPQNIRRKLKELEEHDMIQGVMDTEENYIYLSQEEVTKLCVEILSIEKIKTHEDFVEICNKVISLSINDQVRFSPHAPFIRDGQNVSHMVTTNSKEKALCTPYALLCPPRRMCKN